MLEIGKIINFMDQEHFIKMILLNIKVNIFKIKGMVRVLIFIKIIQNILANGNLINEKAKDNY